MKKLHIGCGKNHLEGYINVDESPKVKPDVVASVMKLPFKTNSIDEIYTAHMMEHMKDFTGAMKELHRVLKPGGKLRIEVPYAGWLSGYIPQHERYFSWISFNPFRKGDDFDYYYDFHFKEVNTKIYFHPINRIISPLANSHPWLYEMTFLSKLFPAMELRVELIK